MMYTSHATTSLLLAQSTVALFLLLVVSLVGTKCADPSEENDPAARRVTVMDLVDTIRPEDRVEIESILNELSSERTMAELQRSKPIPPFTVAEIGTTPPTQADYNAVFGVRPSTAVPLETPHNVYEDVSGP